MNLEDIVFAGAFFSKTAFMPPESKIEAWAYNITGLSIFALGVARYFFGV